LRSLDDSTDPVTRQRLQLAMKDMASEAGGGGASSGGMVSLGGSGAGGGTGGSVSVYNSGNITTFGADAAGINSDAVFAQSVGGGGGSGGMVAIGGSGSGGDIRLDADILEAFKGNGAWLAGEDKQGSVRLD
jgi:hypothetical protein